MSLATYASKTHQKSWNKSDEISDSTNSFFFLGEVFVAVAVAVAVVVA